MKYNTAYIASGKNASNSKEVFGIYNGGGITVLQHDICTGIHPSMRDADIIHTEIAWEQGYEKFTNNTIAEDTTFNQYLEGIRQLCKGLEIPSFIVCGKKLLKRLDPDRVIPITYRFHSYPAYYAVYNYEGPISVKDEFEGRDFVARAGNTILDPCCGYGIIANDILKYSKKGILSDINTECLKYIKETYIGE